MDLTNLTVVVVDWTDSTPNSVSVSASVSVSVSVLMFFFGGRVGKEHVSAYHLLSMYVMFMLCMYICMY